MPATRPKPDHVAREKRKRDASDRLATIKRESLAKWRSWAEAMSTGAPSPDAVLVLSVGAILNIATPMERLAMDAEAFAEFTQCQRNAALCRETVAEKLVECGGSVDKIDATISRLEVELARLRDIRSQVADGCSEGFWINRMNELRRCTPYALGYDDDQAVAA